MLKKLMVLVTALVLAGGIFLTAQGLTNRHSPLPGVTAPITVSPSADRTTTAPAATTPAGSATNDVNRCRADEDASDDRQDGSSDRSGDDCDHLKMVVPTPHVLGDDHGGRDNRVGDDDATGTEDHHGGDDSPGTEDHHRGGDDSGHDSGGRH